MRSLGRFLFTAVPVLGSAIAVACTKENVVFRERPLFEEPPAAAAGFLGYDDQPAKLTVCGNCHVGQQGGWQLTAHAEAWNTLQASGGAQEFCESCHTVSANGNPATGEVGWTSTKDPRYQDVQCESCHGAGEAHVSNPDAVKPLARASVGPEVAASCGDCHSGAHHPFVEEWSVSPHADVVGFAAAREECQACHRGQGTLSAWGEGADYVEKFDSDALPVVCVVCHDPHGSDHEHQLRFPIETTSVEEHLCARCHNRRTAPDPNSSHGLAPHAPEAALLVGDAGWFPPNSQINQGQIRGTHGSAANPELCATCHVASFAVTDAVTGDFVLNATGHLFNPIPCVDAQGVPQPFGTECALTASERAFIGCTNSGCHGSQQAAASALTVASTRIEDRAQTLLSLLGQVDPNLGGPGGQIDAADPTFTVAEGAFFNFNLAFHGNEEFGTNTVLGSTAHNPFLTEALLLASIDAVEQEYGVMANLGIDWKAELQEVLARMSR